MRIAATVIKYQGTQRIFLLAVLTADCEAVILPLLHGKKVEFLNDRIYSGFQNIEFQICGYHSTFQDIESRMVDCYPFLEMPNFD